MTGTRPIEQADPGKMNVDVWKINSDPYPDSIQLFVRVFDTEGKLITNLAPPYYKGGDDYHKIWSGLTEQIGDDGKPVTIGEFNVREFSDQDGIPYELALVLDYSGTMGTNITGLENAAAAFVKLKRDQDRIAVVKFDKTPKLVAAATNSQADILAAFNGNGLKGYGGYTALYEAAKLGAQQLVTAPADHPRAVVLLTDGEDNASTINVSEVYKYCRENNIPVFTVAFGMVNPDVLKDIATYTGGRFYQTYTADELKGAFEDIYRSLRNYYLLTYQPLDVAGRHVVRLTLNPPNSSAKLGASATYNTLTGKIAKGDIFDPGPIFFDYDKATIRPESQAALDAIASVMKEQQRLRIEVRGHTDSKGTEEYNQKLSEARANAVRDALIALGVPEGRVRARGFGLSQPIAPNDTDEGRARNRRTEFIVLAR
jgi:VWFA-related protein